MDANGWPYIAFTGTPGTQDGNGVQQHTPTVLPVPPATQQPAQRSRQRMRMSTGGGGPDPAYLSTTLAERRLRLHKKQLARKAREEGERFLRAARAVPPVPDAVRPYDRAGARAERRRRQEEEAYRLARREQYRRLVAKKPPTTVEEAWDDYQERLGFSNDLALGDAPYGGDFDDESFEEMRTRANRTYLMDVRRINPEFARGVRPSGIGGTLVPPHTTTTQSRRRQAGAPRPPTRYEDSDEDMDMDGAAEFDRAEGVVRTAAQTERLQRATREVADLTNHLLMDRSTRAPGGVISPEEVQEVVKDVSSLYNHHTTGSNSNNTQPEDENGLIGLNLPLTLDPSGSGYIFDANQRRDASDVPAPPTSETRQPAVTLGPQPTLAPDVNAKEHPSNIRVKGTRQLKGNVVRPTDYWKIPEATGDEESNNQLTSTQIKYDRHSDYPRGKSVNYTGARKGDKKAFPEFHSITAAKERLGFAKFDKNFIDLYSPATVYFRYELQRLMKEFGYKKGLRKADRGRFEQFVREVATATRVLPPGIRRVLTQAYDDPRAQAWLEGEDAVDQGPDQEIWDQDRRYFMHPWENLVAHMAETVLQTEADARRCIEQRDGRAPGGHVFGHTPALRRWYGSANNNIPFPVQEFADESVPDIDNTTGHPFGAVDENGRPYRDPKAKKGKKDEDGA